MTIERSQIQLEHNRLTEKHRVRISAYQLSEILSFKDSSDIENSERLSPPAFGALKHVLTLHEMNALGWFNLWVSLKKRNMEIDLYKGSSYGSFFDGLINAISSETVDAPYDKRATSSEVVRILRKISRVANLHIITGDDLSSKKRFKELPKIVQLIFAETDMNSFKQIKAFLGPEETGGQDGIMTILEFKKPAPDYFNAINDIKDEDGNDLDIQEKITLALSDSNHKIESASHEFITPNFIPKSHGHTRLEQPNNHVFLTKELNKKIDDDIEEDLAKLILFKALFSEEMESVVYSMLGIVAAAPLILTLNDISGDNPLTRIFIKFIIPFISDLVTFYAQLKPWLDADALRKDMYLSLQSQYGTLKQKETKRDHPGLYKCLGQIVHAEIALYRKLRPFLEQHTGLSEFYDLQKKLATSHRTSFAASVGAQAIGTPAAEYIATNFNDLLGAWIYSAIPAAVTGATTVDTYRHVKKKTNLKSNKETLKKLFSNPAQLGINIGAFLMFLTGGVVFGNLHQFNNPFLLGLIEGMEEHAVAAASTKTEINLYYGLRFNFWANRVIDHWIEKVGREALREE